MDLLFLFSLNEIHNVDTLKCNNKKLSSLKLPASSFWRERFWDTWNADDGIFKVIWEW